MIDPVVHAALVTVFAFIVRLLFTAIGLGGLDDSIFVGLAGAIVAYILSLFAYGLYVRAKVKAFGARYTGETYHPPFS